MSTIRLRLRRWAAGATCAAIAATGTGVLAAPAHAAPAGAPMPAVCGEETPNARFVRWIYMQILFRCADDAGMAYWTAQLDAGLSRDAFADIIDMSQENLVNNNVVGLYNGILDRMPTPTELADGVAAIRREKSDASLIASLAGSDEGFAKLTQPLLRTDQNVTADEQLDIFIGVAYNAILDRDPDEGGAAYFKGIMGSPSTAASRTFALMIMEHSAENADSWVGATMGGGLLREPDLGGFNYWKGWLMGPGHWQTFRMWTLILSSQEAFNVAQLQPNLFEPEAEPVLRGFRVAS